MADHGPHSLECATAHGGECFCDCHGTKHGIGHMPGAGTVHGHGITVAPVKGHGGRVSHYRVTKTATGLPPGGGTPAERHAVHVSRVKVTATSARPKTLPPPVADKARKVREGLPKDADGWRAITHTGPSRHDKLLDEAGAHDKRATEIEAEKAAAREKLARLWREQGYNDAQVEARAGTTWQLSHYDDMIAKHKAAADAKRAEHAAGVGDKTPGPGYPMDKAGKYLMPPPELDRHLDAVLDVGRQAIAAVKAEFDRDDKVRELRERIEVRKRISAERDELWFGRDPARPGYRLTFDERSRMLLDNEAAQPEGTLRGDEIALRKREREILREVIAAHRDMGGVEHQTEGLTPAGIAGLGRLHKDDTPSPVAADWEKRIRAAEGHYPAGWLKHSAASGPLKVGTSRRAFHVATGDGGSVLAMPGQAYHYSGAYDDSIDEVTVHELGHRMEMTVPGLKALEFAYVRRRATKPNGKLENTRKLKNVYKGAGYRDHEVTFEDQWKNAYAGKTYESRNPQDPASQSWEVFQVGTQDLYGRTNAFDEGDELQAFTLGALLTLA